MRAWTVETQALKLYRGGGGWAIFREGVGVPGGGELVAAVADDEGLIEFFAGQLVLSSPIERTVGTFKIELDSADAMEQVELLRLKAVEVAELFDKLQARPPNPGPEAPPAAIVPPAVEWDIGELAAADTTAMLTLADVKRALAPFLALARAHRGNPDDTLFRIEFDEVAQVYVRASVGDLRALIRAAGLWTDEMQAHQPQTAPGPAAKPAEGAEPPPATSEADVQRLAERYADKDADPANEFDGEMPV